MDHELSECKANYLLWYAGDKEGYRFISKGLLGESINVLSKTFSSDRGILIFIRNLSGCINNYLVPHYIVLHTQGNGYIADDISEYLKIRDFRSENTPHFLNGQVINQEEVLEEIYQESLEERIISHLAEVKELSFSDAMMVYYSSKLACRIHRGEYGVQYLDHKVMARILCEAEPELFSHN